MSIMEMFFKVIGDKTIVVKADGYEDRNVVIGFFGLTKRDEWDYLSTINTWPHLLYIHPNSVAGYHTKHGSFKEGTTVGGWERAQKDDRFLCLTIDDICKKDSLLFQVWKIEQEINEN